MLISRGSEAVDKGSILFVKLTKPLDELSTRPITFVSGSRVTEPL